MVSIIDHPVHLLEDNQTLASTSGPARSWETSWWLIKQNAHILCHCLPLNWEEVWREREESQTHFEMS